MKHQIGEVVELEIKQPEPTKDRVSQGMITLLILIVFAYNQAKPDTGINEQEADVSARQYFKLPSKANTVDQQTQLDYIIKYRETAEKEMKKSGIPASISIAQGIIESKSGSSELVKSSKNHFGIRDGSKYRTYQSDLESWADHSKVLNLPIYRQLKGKNYKQWAIGLEKIGYATDPMYAEKLIEVIERWGLQALDTIPS